LAFITIVGTGPGTKQYLIPEARQAIEDADILIGGERNLIPWIEQGGKKFYVIKAPVIEVVDRIKEHYEREKVVVLVSGDPGFYSILSFLTKHFDKEELKVIPGISSIQIAFARLSLTWHDAVLLNLHGRSLNILDNHLYEPKLALLTDFKNNPLNICQYLISKGRKHGSVYICSKLGYPEEKIATLNLGEKKLLIPEGIASPIVMVIIDE